MLRMGIDKILSENEEIIITKNTNLKANGILYKDLFSSRALFYHLPFFAASTPLFAVIFLQTSTSDVCFLRLVRGIEEYHELSLY